MNTLTSPVYYFNAVRTDGDYLNDWLTHLPSHPWIHETVLGLGVLLQRLLGS